MTDYTHFLLYLFKDFLGLNLILCFCSLFWLCGPNLKLLSRDWALHCMALLSTGPGDWLCPLQVGGSRAPCLWVLAWSRSIYPSSCKCIYLVSRHWGTCHPQLLNPFMCSLAEPLKRVMLLYAQDMKKKKCSYFLKLWPWPPTTTKWLQEEFVRAPGQAEQLSIKFVQCRQ